MRNKLALLTAILLGAGVTALPANAAVTSGSPGTNPATTPTTTPTTTTPTTPTTTTPGTTTPKPKPTVHLKSGYINPFKGGDWLPSRIDMGMDWIEQRTVPVKAIGAAKILGSDSHAGWPGGHIIWYQLLTGSHAGDIVYVAEHLKKLVKAGTIVQPGQTIALALPGYPWTEWGWADSYGSPRAYPCYKEGRVTNSGKEMARFLTSLGAVTAGIAGAGPSSPIGRRC